MAYEALCGLAEHRLRALVTVGSPLGIANLVFDRLDPSPKNGLGQWPGREGLAWTNIADHGDAVAVEKDLRPRFGKRVSNTIVHNGSHAHDVTAYLTDPITGASIAAGLHAH